MRIFTGLFVSKAQLLPSMKKTNSSNYDFKKKLNHHRSISVKAISIEMIAYFSKLINSHYVSFWGCHVLTCKIKILYHRMRLN